MEPLASQESLLQAGEAKWNCAKGTGSRLVSISLYSNTEQVLMPSAEVINSVSIPMDENC